MKRAKKDPWRTRCARRLSLRVDNEVDAWVPPPALFFRWVFAAFCREYSYATIGILLCSEEKAKYYNKSYRAKDYATNILSFPLNEETRPQSLIGDLIICPRVVEREAREQKKALSAHYAHLVVHGMLHLMNYDHIEESQAKVMETKEIAILREMGIENPYGEE